MAVSIISMTTNNSDNGYCKMPDGTLIQWGSTFFPPVEATGLQTLDVTLPIVFATTSGYRVTAVWADMATTNNIKNYVTDLSVNNSGKTTSSIQFNCIRVRTNLNWWFDYIAIGRWK